MIIFIIFILTIIILNIVIKFKPRFEINEEGLFIHYTIRGKLDEGKRYVQEIIRFNGE